MQGIDGFCMQETCLLRSFSTNIQGHLLLHHDMKNKTIHRGRTSIRVAIIIGPALIRYCSMSGKTPPITSARNSDFPGHMIGVTLCFLNRSNNILNIYHKKGKRCIKICLCLIHHPMENDDQKRFNKELASIYNTIPRNY